MTKEQALELIDKHKNSLIDPVEMLKWTHLRVIISMITEDEWIECLLEAGEVLSR